MKKYLSWNGQILGRGGRYFSPYTRKYALQFDGVDDRVFFQSSNIGAKSISFWMRLNTIKRMGIFSGVFSDGYIIFINADNGIGCYRTNVPNGSTFNFIVGELYHITINNDSANSLIEIYVDGQSTSLVGKGGWRFNNNYEIGGVSPNLPFNGAVSKINIFDRFLTQSEITQLYNNKNKLISEGLIARYMFNEVGSCTLLDNSLNNYNGTLLPDCPTNSPEWIKL